MCSGQWGCEGWRLHDTHLILGVVHDGASARVAAGACTNIHECGGPVFKTGFGKVASAQICFETEFLFVDG